MSKSVAITLPAVLLLVEWWRGPRLTRRNWLLTAPFGAIAVAFAAFDLYLVSRAEKHRARHFMAGTHLCSRDGRVSLRKDHCLAVNLCPVELRWFDIPSSGSMCIVPAALVVALLTVLAKHSRRGKGPLAPPLIYCHTVTHPRPCSLQLHALFLCGQPLSIPCLPGTSDGVRDSAGARHFQSKTSPSKGFHRTRHGNHRYAWKLRTSYPTSEFTATTKRGPTLSNITPPPHPLAKSLPRPLLLAGL